MQLKIAANETLRTLLDREKIVPTCVGNGIAMPHMCVPMRRPYIFAVGRCQNGVFVDGHPEYCDVRLIILVLFGEGCENYLSIFNSIMHIFSDKEFAQILVENFSIDRLYDTISGVLDGHSAVMPTDVTRRHELCTFLKESFRLAIASGCTCILFFGDAVNDLDVFSSCPCGMKRVLVTARPREILPTNLAVDHVLTVSSYANYRLVQLRSAILLALSRDILHMEEKVCCIGGVKGSDCLDCILIVNVAEEYRALLNARRGLIPKNVKPEVFDRLVAIAHEIALEGREGHSVGSMFIVGQHDRLKNYYRPLVLNPFHGYSRDERNMLNPFMDETIKEFAALDGAFIVDGDGVMEAAGVMVHVPDEHRVVLQSGFGTRHTAAAAFTRAHDCLAVVISQSSGQISIFRNGQMLSLSGKIIG
jgi:DNA integrity scanning protein DisA with diadenylate cyclase activity/mannitol/fructose-specific phosphotransferase system IIA component (Ntr-type)